ncbi:MAG: hypothetical protein V7K41_29840 [Nostoc sp.]|uniref:hypothetical protein n=1 Tax=Nostoc sp. TaxID=1180 RepID=UPI002FF8CAEC
MRSPKPSAFPLNIKSPADVGYWNYTYLIAMPAAGYAYARSEIPFKELVVITSAL